MSNSKQSTLAAVLAKIETQTLGIFASVPPSERIEHLTRYLFTWSGHDKFLMLIQYSLKIIVPFLNLRARLQHKAGRRTAPTSYVTGSLAKFGDIIGDARMLNNFWGILNCVQWLTSLERNPALSPKLRRIERIQAWSFLLYYPLEHLYYLLAHSIIPATLTLPSLFSRGARPSEKSTGTIINLNAGAISRVSCQLWAVYVFLQFFHLAEDRKQIIKQERELKKSKVTLTETDKTELKRSRDVLLNEFLVNVGYFPLTLHWSLKGGVFNNEVWVGVFGLLAAIAGWRNGWKATAKPTPPPEIPEPSSASSGGVSEKTDTVMDPDINDLSRPLTGLEL